MTWRSIVKSFSPDENNSRRKTFRWNGDVNNTSFTMATHRGEPLSVVVVGASGDLARKKTYPALFKLFCMSLLPKHTTPVPTIALIPRACKPGKHANHFYGRVLIGALPWRRLPHAAQNLLRAFTVHH